MLLSTVDAVASNQAQRGLSVIVPLAPGEAEWPELVLQLAALPAGSEVILVASDDTPRPAPESWPPQLDYRVCRSPAGRARQQNLGASVASGEWLWFLHADSRLRPGTVAELQLFVARGDEALGWFTLAFRGDGPRWTALNAAGANWRARWLGLPFGDQGLLLPRHCFEALHGFDELAHCGEDHLLVWAARRAGLPLRHIPAVLETSARKYARHGWLGTTLRHWRLTGTQAWSARRTMRKGRTPALAIFVKTPGLSPVKTRLAATLGAAAATRFHQLAASATGEVARSCRSRLTPYWAIAEAGPVAAAAWPGFASLHQGGGGLGERLHAVYSQLLARHGRVLLIGADAPQLTAELLRAAIDRLDDDATSFVIGDASDGGFWLFGGSAPIPREVWTSVRYSQPRTAAELRERLTPHGGVAGVPALTDVDSAADLPVLFEALAELVEPLPAQRLLHDWLQLMPDRVEPSAVQG